MPIIVRWPGIEQQYYPSTYRKGSITVAMAKLKYYIQKDGLSCVPIALLNAIRHITGQSLYRSLLPQMLAAGQPIVDVGVSYRKILLLTRMFVSGPLRLRMATVVNPTIREIREHYRQGGVAIFLMSMLGWNQGRHAMFAPSFVGRALRLTNTVWRIKKSDRDNSNGYSRSDIYWKSPSAPYYQYVDLPERHLARMLRRKNSEVILLGG